jgi:hypothetical protein
MRQCDASAPATALRHIAVRTTFICYRRADSREIAGRLYQALTSTLGYDHVFRDVDSIPLGIDFRQVIQEELDRSDIFIAVLGPSWLQAADAAGNRRLDNSGDFVRIEIESALERTMPVVVVLAEGAALPVAGDLPVTLAPLLLRPVFPLRSGPPFQEDVARLLTAICALPVLGRRPMTSRNRWAEALDRGFRKTLLGEAIGLVFGLAIAVAHRALQGWLLEWVGGDVDFVRVFLPVLLAGTLVGVRHLRFLGLLAGPVVGFIGGAIASIVLFVSTVIVILALALARAVLDALGIGMKTVTDAQFGMSGLFGTVAAWQAVFWMARKEAKWIARRKSARRWLSRLVAAFFAGALPAGLLALAVLRLVDGVIPHGSLDDQSVEDAVMVLHTTFVGGVSAWVDSLLTVWRAPAGLPCSAKDRASPGTAA